MPEPVAEDPRLSIREHRLTIPIADAHHMSIDPDSGEIKIIGETVSGFRWRDHLIQQEAYKAQFENFCKNHPDFPVTSKQLTAMVDDAFDVTNTVYEAIFPGGSCPLPYHDIVHAKVTGITAMKLFLGALVSDKNMTQDLIKSDQLATAIQTFLITSCLHEFNDWLERPDVALPSNFQTAKDLTCKLLENRNISFLDVDKIFTTDDYRKKIQDSLQTAVQLKPNTNPSPNTTPNTDSQFKPKEAFLSCSGEQTIPPIFDNILLLHIAQACIATADFLQIANPAYFEECYVLDNQGKTHKCSYALLTLYWEMVKYRQEGLIGAGWRDPRSNFVDIKRLQVNEGFVEDVAIPRIKTGIHFLREFNPGEHDRAMSVITQARLVYLSNLPAQP